MKTQLLVPPKERGRESGRERVGERERERERDTRLATAKNAACGATSYIIQPPPRCHHKAAVVVHTHTHNTHTQTHSRSQHFYLSCLEGTTYNPTNCVLCKSGWENCQNEWVDWSHLLSVSYGATPATTTTSTTTTTMVSLWTDQGVAITLRLRLALDWNWALLKLKTTLKFTCIFLHIRRGYFQLGKWAFSPSKTCSRSKRTTLIEYCINSERLICLPTTYET